MTESVTQPAQPEKAPRRYRRPSGLKFGVSPAARRLRVDVYARDDFTCRDCGYRPPFIPSDYDGRFTLGDLTLDHIVPALHGGLWRRDNLATRCRSCNARRGAWS